MAHGFCSEYRGASRRKAHRPNGWSESRLVMLARIAKGGDLKMLMMMAASVAMKRRGVDDKMGEKRQEGKKGGRMEDFGREGLCGR